MPAADAQPKVRPIKTSPLERIYRKRDLPIFTGVERTTIEKLIREGKFPRGLAINDSGNTRGWTETELIRWQKQWIRDRRKHAEHLAKMRRIHSMPDVEADAAE